MRHVRLVALLLASALYASAASATTLLKVGERFPTWTLLDHTGTPVSSSTLRGQTYLLWFYPKAMTPGCTAEGDGLRDKYGEFRKAGITVFGVSFDKPKDNAKFVEKESFPFALLSDTKRRLALRVGAADSPQQTTARRISYLIGGDGKVLRVYAAVTPTMHAADVLRDLGAATP